MKFYIVSLGCAKNLVDSETIIDDLLKSGHSLTNSENQADAVLIMTCAFIESAKKETREVIKEFIRKKKRFGFKIFAGGCYPKRYFQSVSQEFPEVDGWFGIGDLSKLVNFLEKAERGESLNLSYTPKTCGEYSGRFLTTPKHWAWLKISDGCSHKCAYCAIPSIRGNYRSRTLEDIGAEAEDLASKGVKELQIIAQDVGMYGVDLYKKQTLVDLLKILEKIEGIKWIRLLYINPFSMPGNLPDFMANSEKTLHYLDLPMQHSSPSVLKRMRRAGSGQEYLELIRKLRDKMPSISIRSSFIVGFPGETDEEYLELKNFLQTAKINRAGFFSYSDEEGTEAFALGEKTTAGVKSRRLNDIIRTQAKISSSITKERKGSKTQAIIDSKYDKRTMKEFALQFSDKKLTDGNLWIARTKWDAPEADALMLLDGGSAKIAEGDIVETEITHTSTYDVAGRYLSHK